MITDYFLKRCIWTNILSGLNQYDLPCVLPTTVEYIIDLIMKTDREMMLHNNLGVTKSLVNESSAAHCKMTNSVLKISI